MKITVIHGQNHQGSTCHIARTLCEKLGGEVTEFFLPRDFGAFCVGCSQCFSKSETLCPHYEKLRPLTLAMDEADVIVLASPVYVYHVTGPMKAFLDHYGYRWMVHRPDPRMFRKQVVCLSTAAGAGTRSTNKDMADSAFFWGANRIYRYGAAVAAVSWDGVSPKLRARIDRDLTALASRVRKNAGKSAPSLKTRGFFHVMRLLQKRGWNEADCVYWRQRGWDKFARPWKA
jgi:NAD(P)H-dependent FMN reductase